ncbi:MAG: hypothetical protein NTZ43_13090 [Gemmatimonadetes bacterium]|nr:hypothetical protein [Gemmatimonadota bacterium]
MIPLLWGVSSCLSHADAPLDGPGGAPNANTPAIGLSTNFVSFSGPRGGAGPGAQAVVVSNAGGGQLTSVTAGPVAYNTGEPTGWLSTTTSSSNAPSTITLTPFISALSGGNYSATLPVRSSATGVTNSPQLVTVSLTIFAPAIAVSAASATFSATPTGATAPTQQIAVTNSANGTLNALSVGSVSYVSGAATGWLSAELSATAAPATLTLAVNATGIVPGAYLARVPVVSAAAGITNSPVFITVTFNVIAPNALAARSAP